VDGPAPDQESKKPHCLIVLGMAGSGKSSFIRRFKASFASTYCVNLDPAVAKLAFPA
jgi:GTPase SAR1 family protein